MSDSHRLPWQAASSVILAAASLLLWSPAASAIMVTTTADENGANPENCALREAVRSINNRSSFGGCVFTPGDSVIELGADTYQLSLNIGVSDRVLITKPLTISGQGPGQTTIERIGVFDDDLLFIVLNEPGRVILEGFTIQGTREKFNSAIDYLTRPGSELIIRDMVFRDHVAETGAPLRIQGDNDGAILVERVIFEDNENFGVFAEGGGIDCSADETPAIPFMRLVDVLFRNNTVSATDNAMGGGMSSIGCDLELINVTFDSNSTRSVNQTAVGGGLLVLGGDNPNTVTLTNVTFFGNSADIAGGFGQSQDTAAPLSVTLSNVSFAGNTATESGDHLYQDAGTTRLRNVLFGPSALTACNSTAAPAITLLGGNMDSDGSCGVEFTTPDPGLADSLAFDGGFTPTVALRPDAAAIDAGTNDGCTATDQRGASRPFDGDGDGIARCDIGAHERAPVPALFSNGFEAVQDAVTVSAG